MNGYNVHPFNQQSIMCPLCLIFVSINPGALGNHFHHFHGGSLLHSSQILARTMFLGPVGYREAMEVLKDIKRLEDEIKRLRSSNKATKRTVNGSTQTDEGNLNKNVENFEVMWKSVETVKESLKADEDLKLNHREVAKLTSQLVLSKEHEQVLNEEVDRLRETVKQQETLKATKDVLEASLNIEVQSLKSFSDSKDLVIVQLKTDNFELTKENDSLKDQKYKLRTEISDLKKLLEVTRKSNLAKLDQKDLKLMDATELLKKVKEKIKIASKERDLKDDKCLNCEKELIADKVEQYKGALNLASDSLNEALNIQTDTAEKLIEAICNTKKATKYMEETVVKRCKEFQVEVTQFEVSNVEFRERLDLGSTMERLRKIVCPVPFGRIPGVDGYDSDDVSGENDPIDEVIDYDSACNSRVGISPKRIFIKERSDEMEKKQKS